MDSPLSSAERPRLTADCHLGAPRHRNWHVIGLPAGIKIVPGQQKKADRNVARGVVPGSAGDECGRDAEAPGRRRAPPWRPGRGDFILKVTQWKRGVAADKWFPSPYQALSLHHAPEHISFLFSHNFVYRSLCFADFTARLNGECRDFPRPFVLIFYFFCDSAFLSATQAARVILIYWVFTASISAPGRFNLRLLHGRVILWQFVLLLSYQLWICLVTGN